MVLRIKIHVTGLTSQQGKTAKILITGVMAVELTSGKYIISRAIWLLIIPMSQSLNTRLFTTPKALNSFRHFFGWTLHQHVEPFTEIWKNIADFSRKLQRAPYTWRDAFRRTRLQYHMH